MDKIKESILIITVGLLLLATNAVGQSFAEVGTNWHVGYHANGLCPGANCEYVHFESVYDTVVNGDTLHKVTSIFYSYYGDTIKSGPLLFKETTDTVWLWSHSRSKLLVTYVYSGQVGDTIGLDAPDTFGGIHNYKLIIDSISIKQYQGIGLRHFFVRSLGDYFFSHGYYIERIGHMSDILPNLPTFPEGVGTLRCYLDNDLDLNFKSSACDRLLTTGIDRAKESQSVSIYPNPANTIIHIQSESPVEFVRLFDLLGREILTTTSSTLDIMAIPVGTYLLHVQFASDTYYSKMIQKNAR